jgi:hypothetical protein
MFNLLQQRWLDRFRVDDSIGWSDIPEDPLSDQIMDMVWDMLDKATLNARKRKIVWPDGQKLSINLSVKRIHEQHPTFPTDLIENNVIDWLVQVMPPDIDTEQQIDELNRLKQKWLDTYER